MTNRTLFEFLVLEGAQAGLSWETILKKRGNYRDAFDQFRSRHHRQVRPEKVQELADGCGYAFTRVAVRTGGAI